VVPPHSIICSVTQLTDRYAEKEYLVDRRSLKGVTVIQRYHQLEHSTLARLNRARPLRR